MHPLSRFVRSHMAALGEFGRRRVPVLRRVPKLQLLVEAAARIGFGARGFVYLTAGAVTLLAALDRREDAAGVRGALAWIAGWPAGVVWVVLIGIGLALFSGWRILQSVFDADHEGTSRHGLMTRAGQFASALSYAGASVAVFKVLDRLRQDFDAAETAEAREKVSTVLDLPHGGLILIVGGLVIIWLAGSNMWRGFREDFTEYLACSEKLCRRVEPLARAGYIARGVSYLPLGVLVVLAGLRSQSHEVMSLGEALGAVDSQPGGNAVIALTAAGLMAFGAFSWVEARFRKVRAPRDLNPLN